MLTYLSILLLGAASRASVLVFDAEARMVMLDHWQLNWTTLHGTGIAGVHVAHASLG